MIKVGGAAETERTRNSFRGHEVFQNLVLQPRRDKQVRILWVFSYQLNIQILVWGEWDQTSGWSVVKPDWLTCLMPSNSFEICLLACLVFHREMTESKISTQFRNIRFSCKTPDYR